MSKKPDTIITIKNVTVQFGEYTAIKDVTTNILKGSITAIIGPNGSGKSTLAKAMVGLERITKGTIRINKKSVQENIGEIGYVPQRFSFDKTLPITVYEFLNLSVCEKRHHKNRAQIDNVLQLVGMIGMEEKRLGTLSGGQLQRILIARALLHEQDIMILDEPSTGIDAAGERDLYKLIKDINKKRNTTFIIISHELDFVSKYADYVVCLNKTLICNDTPEKALVCEGVQDLYGPHIAVHVHHDHT